MRAGSRARQHGARRARRRGGARRGARRRRAARGRARRVRRTSPRSRPRCWARANVTVTPHIGGLSDRSIARMTEQATESVLSVLAGRPDRGLHREPGGAAKRPGWRRERAAGGPLAVLGRRGRRGAGRRAGGARAGAPDGAPPHARRCDCSRSTTAQLRSTVPRPPSSVTWTSWPRSSSPSRARHGPRLRPRRDGSRGSCASAREEALRLGGELLPMDAAPASAGRLGYTRPYPAGVVAAITPFNYPAILVVHKVGPALAAGNAVVLKPASATPLDGAVPGRAAGRFRPARRRGPVRGRQRGRDRGRAAARTTAVRMVTLHRDRTRPGSAIARSAGAKRLACELGSNAALVVLDDADLDLAARRDRPQRLHERGPELRLDPARDRRTARAATSSSSDCSSRSMPRRRAIRRSRTPRSGP